MRRLKNIFAIFMVFIMFGVSSVFAADKYARVVLVGDLSSGKTSLWKRILGHEFDMEEARSDLMVRENVTKTIKKLFNEEKIPIEKRDKILMLANASNILWIEGQGVSSEAKVKESTKKVILIFEEETNNAQ